MMKDYMGMEQYLKERDAALGVEDRQTVWRWANDVRPVPYAVQVIINTAIEHLTAKEEA